MEKSPDKHIKSESAYVMVNCECGAESAVLEELQSMDEVREIEHTMGNYDIILKIETGSIDILRDLIAVKIRRTHGVVATTTLISTGSVEPMLVPVI